jgi:hypothetical protein
LFINEKIFFVLELRFQKFELAWKNRASEFMFGFVFMVEVCDKNIAKIHFL